MVVQLPDRSFGGLFFIFKGIGIENNAKGIDTSLPRGIAEMRFAESGGVRCCNARKGGGFGN